MDATTQEQNNRISSVILNKIAEHIQDDAVDVTLQTPLSDLGIHSLELTEIIFDIEDEFDIEVDMNTSEAWENLGTVGDIVDAVRELVAAKS